MSLHLIKTNYIGATLDSTWDFSVSKAISNSENKKAQSRQPPFLHLFFYDFLLQPPSLPQIHSTSEKSFKTCVADGASSTNVSCGYLLVCVGTRTESVNWSYRSNCCDNSILLLLPLYACPSMIEKGSSPECGCQRGWARLPVPSRSALLAGRTHAQSELAEE